MATKITELKGIACDNCMANYHIGEVITLKMIKCMTKECPKPSNR